MENSPKVSRLLDTVFKLQQQLQMFDCLCPRCPTQAIQLQISALVVVVEGIGVSLRGEEEAGI